LIGNERLAERSPRLVLRDHHGKAELLERIAHGAGVVDRLLQFWNVLVVVVADHQRDALFRMRGLGKGEIRHHQAHRPCGPERQPILHPCSPLCAT
jgi:hypothetical protein